MTRRVSVSTYYWIDDWNRQQTEVFAMTKDTGFDGVDLQQLVRDRLGAYKYPREVEFMQVLPKTVTGKLNRRLLTLREENLPQPAGLARRLS